MGTYLVMLTRSGPAWDRSRPAEAQSQWAEHAAFMNALVDDGFVILGGPLADDHRVPLIVEADAPETIRATLARDPWSESHLRVDAIEPWTILLDGRR